MTELTRYCTGCGEERPFDQMHAEPGSCPDVAQGDCPEWGCTACGDAVLIGLVTRTRHETDGASRAA
jgi:hypothetical protein